MPLVLEKIEARQSRRRLLVLKLTMMIDKSMAIERVEPDQGGNENL